MNFQLFSAVWLVLMILCSAQPGVFESHDESFNMWPQFRNAHGIRKINISDSSEQKINWSGTAYCFNGTKEYDTVTDLTSDVIQDLSTCPWFWQLNYDETRTPAILMTAKCSCTECQGPVHPREASCQEIYYLRKVTYHKNTQREEERLFRLAVGCTCFRGPPRRPPAESKTKGR